MKQRLLSLLLIPAGSLLVTGAKAATLATFSLTNTNNSNVVSFGLPASGTPSGVGLSCPYNTIGDFCYTSQPVNVNGVTSLDTVEFFNSAASGGLEIFNGATSEVNLYGAQLFTGPVSSPTFLAGTFPLSTNVEGSPSYSLTIASPVPEPGSMALLGTGLLAGMGVIRRKLQR